MQNIRRHFLITLFGQIVTAAQAFIVMALIIRTAGLIIYGSFVMWSLGLTFIFVLTYFGVGYNYRRKLASTDCNGQRRELFLPQFTYQLTGLAVLGLVVLIFLAPHHEKFGEGSIGVAAWIIIVWLAVQFVLFQTQEYFRGTMRFYDYSIINTGNALLNTGLIVGWAVGGFPRTLGVLLILSIISRLLIVAPWATKLIRELGVPRFSLPLGLLWEDMKVGWPSLLDYISMTALNFGDRYLIATFMSVADVGRYQPGYQLASFLLFIPRCGETILLPVLSRQIDAGDHVAAELTVSETLHFFFMISIPYVVGAVLLGPSIVAPLSTPAIAQNTAWVTALVVIGIVLYGMAIISYQIAYVIRKMQLALWGNLIGALLNIGLNLIFLPLFRSLTAAALACLLSYGGAAVYILWKLRRQWHFHIQWSRVARFAIAAAIMYVALAFLGYRPLTVSSTSLITAILATAVGATVYFAVLYLIGGLKFRAMAALAGSALSHR